MSDGITDAFKMSDDKKKLDSVLENHEKYQYHKRQLKKLEYLRIFHEKSLIEIENEIKTKTDYK